MEDEGRIRTRCYEKSAFVTKFRDHPTSSRVYICRRGEAGRQKDA